MIFFSRELNIIIQFAIKNCLYKLSNLKKKFSLLSKIVSTNFRRSPGYAGIPFDFTCIPSLSSIVEKSILFPLWCIFLQQFLRHSPRYLSAPIIYGYSSDIFAECRSRVLRVFFVLFPKLIWTPYINRHYYTDTHTERKRYIERNCDR